MLARRLFLLLFLGERVDIIQELCGGVFYNRIMGLGITCGETLDLLYKSQPPWWLTSIFTLVFGWKGRYYYGATGLDMWWDLNHYHHDSLLAISARLWVRGYMLFWSYGIRHYFWWDLDGQNTIMIGRRNHGHFSYLSQFSLCLMVRSSVAFTTPGNASNISLGTGSCCQDGNSSWLAQSLQRWIFRSAMLRARFRSYITCQARGELSFIVMPLYRG